MLRYGDEVGMGENLRLKERGFSNAKRTVQPVIQTGLYSAANVNVEQQRRDPSSLLRRTSRLIRTRKKCPRDRMGHAGYRANPPRQHPADPVCLAEHVARLRPQPGGPSRRGDAAARPRTEAHSPMY